MCIRDRETEANLATPSVRLTELFVDDMDGQLRESGVGDLVVGKHVGRLMGALGGRLGALRNALAQAGAGEGDTAPVNTPLAEALARNVTLRDGAGAVPLAGAVRALANQLAELPTESILSGDIVLRDLP